MSSRWYMASSMSSGSKPATAAGIPYSRGRKANSSAPVITATCPGQIKASTAKPSEAVSALRAGCTRLSMENTVKFSRPLRSASSRAAAVPGAVVSNPTPRKTNCLRGSAAAISSASMGEYTIRTSAPRALRCARSSPRTVPGTRSISP